MNRIKFYAVRRGRETGIFDNWERCSNSVHGFKGAVYKSFPDRGSAEEYLQNVPDPETDESLPYAYIDGTFKPSSGVYGYGGFIKYGGKYYMIQGTGSHPAFTSERNIAGELIGTLQTIWKAVNLGITEMNLYFDYEGIEQWSTGGWTAKTELSKCYRDAMRRISDRITVHFIKVKGHTGIEGNELADIIAKDAVGIKLRKKDAAALNDFKNKAVTV